MAASMEDNDLTAALAAINAECEHPYHIKKKVMETMLYTIYIISTKEEGKFSDRVLLINHPPAEEPSSCLMPVELQESETMNEKMKKIVAALHSEFAL
ncbi:hypothetical protein ACTL32_01210 [Planococcus sp. FY231025]|uniref:hypothetical protein n=1 Tax=Planococcus sp. FY231025 TaxID=3455699 RepID=UPI003F93C8F2